MNLTKNEVRYTPQKVVNLAYDLGVHEICVTVDWEGACESCISVFHTAFDSFYGHAESSEEALMMIINDILEDRDTASQ